MSDIFDDPDAIEDLFRDTGGKLATFGEYQAWGHLEVLDEAMLDDDVRTRVRGAKWTFTFATGKLPGLGQRNKLMVGESAFEVREVLRRTDGGESVAFLAGVPG